MVGVVVGVKDGVDDADPAPEQLQPQFGGRVDEDIPLGGADQHTAAVTVVARVGGTAHGALTADHRHAHRRAGPQKSEDARRCHLSLPVLSIEAWVGRHPVHCNTTGRLLKSRGRGFQL